MTDYIIRRLIQSAVLLFFISMLLYVILNLVPGGPFDMLRLSNPRMTGSQLDRLNALLDLDKPLLPGQYCPQIGEIQEPCRFDQGRYLRWLGKVVQGDWGKSWTIANGKPVLGLIGGRLWYTVLLMGISLVVAIIIAVPIGIYSAIHQYSIIDYFVTALAFFGQSMPTFWTGLMAMAIFSVALGWFPTSGVRTAGSEGDIIEALGRVLSFGRSHPELAGQEWATIVDGLKHLALPAGVLVFFGLAFVITSLLLYWYSGSLMITALALICAVVPVIWLLGLLPIFGLGLDPMSILVPFLIFSIAVSHAVQMTNAWKLETLHGADGVTASTHSFQKLFIPGAMALLANALGFMVIAFVEIEIVRELAFTATIGVTVMIITNKMLLPILLSYYKFTPEQASKLAGKETAGDWLWERIGGLATRRVAWIPLLVGVALLAFGISQARHLHIGDLGKGVPELRENSRYNQDVAMITSHFAIGVDLLQVIAEAKPESDEDSPCVNRDVMDKIEDFEFQMRQVDGVASARGLSGFVKGITQSFAETYAKWRMLPEATAQIAQGVGYATRLGNEFMNSRCTAMRYL